MSAPYVLQRVTSPVQVQSPKLWIASGIRDTCLGGGGAGPTARWIGPVRRGEYGVIVEGSGQAGGRAERDPGRSHLGRHAATIEPRSQPVNLNA